MFNFARHIFSSVHLSDYSGQQVLLIENSTAEQTDLEETPIFNNRSNIQMLILFDFFENFVNILFSVMDILLEAQDDKSYEQMIQDLSYVNLM